MSNVYLAFNKYTYTTRNPSTDDDWDRGDTSSVISFEGLSLRAPENSDYESVETSSEFKAGDTGYAVVVTYNTGDSFGWDNNCRVELIDVFKTYEEAVEVEESILNNSYQGYKPWDGYFESLNSTQIIAEVLV